MALAGLMSMIPVMAHGETGAMEQGELTVRFEGLRSEKGLIRACLTRNPKFYPDCEKDPAALKQSISARKDAVLTFSHVVPGDYALVVLHDENSNGKVDTMLGIPREGVGFSRDAPIRFGPPKWDAVRFHVPNGPSATSVTFKYFL